MSPPRILLFSQRNAVARKWHASLYEFEDVIAEVDAVRMLAPAAKALNPTERLIDRVLRKAGRLERNSRAPIQAVDVEGRYDLFFTAFSFAGEAIDLLALRNWRERCDKAACFLLEVYTSHLHDETRRYLELLRSFSFDRVYTFNPRPARQIEEIVGCPVEYLATGVDALRFSPYPDPPERGIDLYEFGRHSPVTHAAALDMARSAGAFFVYDTVFDVPLPDYRAHRELTAEHLKRARYFFAYRAGEDRPNADTDDPVSSRYFEGIAGGPILLGSAPRSPEFRADFDWPDAVIDIPYEAHGLREIIAELDAQPERLARARSNNVVNTLRRHDWVYRWQRVLADAALAPTPAMDARVDSLRTLAELAVQDPPSPAR
jgi:hypothetical protein